MAAPPLVDPEPSAGGTVAATPAASPVSDAGAAGAAQADETLEHGWTGLGLPKHEPEAAPVSVKTTAPGEIAKRPESPAAPAPPVKAAPPAGPLAPPRPMGKSGASPAVAPPRPMGKSGASPAVAPPRPMGKSGASPAVSLPASRAAAPAPAPAAASTPPAAPPAATPAPVEVRAVEPAARPSRPTPMPASSSPQEAPAARPSPVIAAPAAPAPPPPLAEPAETDVTFEEEPDFSKTIPDTHLPFEDLGATVPMLMAPVMAPSFGLPNEPTGGASSAEDGGSPYGPGAIIGDKYQLIRVVGRGGMGAVWIAQNTALEVEVAIKLMRRDRATVEAAARFSTEARAAAKLGHPSIVRVFDFGETSRGDPFIVMELLRGESFGALLARKKRLSPTVAVQTLLPVAHALAAAHNKGIVHRDLKPDNILLARDESNVVTPKVVDFGIAKLVSADVERHFTIAGEVLGSPDYMSPEQARGEDDIDHRSDIWTFSVLLYEAVCGRRPFMGANYNALLAAIIASRPPPITEQGVPDPDLWTIIEKGLAKERDARWQSLRELGIELARWAIERGAEHDLVGASLAAQWLEPNRRRLFTVGGSGETPAPDEAAMPAAAPAIPKPPPLGNLAAEMPRTAAPVISNTLPPFVPRRRPWLVITLIIVLGGGLVAAIMWGGLFDPPPAPPAPAPAASMTSVPSSSASEAPSASSSAPTGAPSTKPTSSSKVRPTGSGKPKAPQVKGDIKF